MTVPCSPILASRQLLIVAACAVAGACAAQSQVANAPAPAPDPQAAAPSRLPWSSTYAPGDQGAPVLIRNATILTGTGARIDGGDVLLEHGRIGAVGRGLQAPAGARVIDASGRWVTPGLIDVHSHLGVYPSPGLRAHSDGNEATDPVTAGVWAEHSVWPQDPGFERALEGGVTTLQILPGSANLIGGRGVTVKNVWARSYQEMKFPGAPQGLKMACGENPKRVYGGRQKLPSTRMGNVAGYRQAFADAQDYREQWKEYEAKLAVFQAGTKPDATPPKPPKRDLRLETLAAAMQGELLVHNHCYRADEMAIMLDLAQEFGFRISAFHHGVEAYKLADRLAAAGTCGALWADWWGFKLEAWDSVQENLAIVDAAPGGCAIVHSDSSEGIQRLNQEAAKAMTRGVRAGLAIPPERAIRWVTSNAAKSLGILEQTGTLEAGKMADVVIWNGTPFSVYALAELVFVDGALRFDRARPAPKPRSDFEL
ncbi:MAG TPA: amidohydrolase [Steroidobacteraceae bacterium]|nr:amidohydrolase [Steroidobacteraceae bacterium]